MKNDLLNIKNMCTKYITEPKLLIVPNMSIKGQIQKTLVDENIFSANLFMKTLDD